MRAEQIVATVITWARLAALGLLMAILLMALLRAVGVSIPIRTIDHVALAYLAGVYWLTRG